MLSWSSGLCVCERNNHGKCPQRRPREAPARSHHTSRGYSTSATSTAAAMPDWIAPIDASGAFLDGNGLVPIDAAHRSALPHRGIWLHVLTQNYELLLVRRSSKMATCPDSLSIVGEHMSGREKEEHAARRGIREELPGFVSLLGTPALTLTPLRPGRSSRWFLYDIILCVRSLL